MPLTAQVHENGKFLRKKSNGWERQGTFISSGDDTKQKPNILFHLGIILVLVFSR